MDWPVAYGWILVIFVLPFFVFVVSAFHRAREIERLFDKYKRPFVSYFTAKWGGEVRQIDSINSENGKEFAKLFVEVTSYIDMSMTNVDYLALRRLGPSAYEKLNYRFFELAANYTTLPEVHTDGFPGSGLDRLRFEILYEYEIEEEE